MSDENPINTRRTIIVEEVRQVELGLLEDCDDSAQVAADAYSNEK